MKNKINYQSAFLSLRASIGLFTVLLAVSVALVGSRANSRESAETNRSTGLLQRAPATVNARSSSNDVALRDNPQRYVDEKGNRANGFKPAPALRAKHRGGPAGVAAWVSLGPPGGDVFDVAASTLDANIVLAGLAPGGSFGGTLYRSSDGGNT